MNYRHAFHAGNHGDVLKHAVLAATLERMVAKPKPMTYVDVFAGAGRYDLLLDERAARTEEWRDGLERVWAPADGEPTAFASYRAVLALLNPRGGLRWSPGSPAVAQSMLRPDDKIQLVELHREEASALRNAMTRDRRVRVLEQDAWAALKSLLPPTPRRGLVLIDPPFERPGEFDRMAEAIAGGLKRWATGVFLLWHPLVDQAVVERYVAAARRAVGAAPSFLVSLQVRSPDAEGMTGSGLICVNPPFGLAESVEELGHYLAQKLGSDAAAKATFRWLVEPV